MNRKSEREYDRIAGSRIAKMGGGIPLYVALGSKSSIILRNKLKRLGIKGEHIEDLLKLVDEVGIQESLKEQPLGVRFATVKTKRNKPKVWNKNE